MKRSRSYAARDALPAGPAAALAERWRTAWTGRGSAGFADCCAPDVHYEDPVALEPLVGLDGLSAHAERLRRAFPDLRVESSGPTAGQDRFVCIPWRCLGTQKGHLPGLPPTGRFVTLHGVHYVEVVDARIRRARGFFDLYDVAVQLGLLPVRGSLGEAALLLVRGFGLRPRA